MPVGWHLCQGSELAMEDVGSVDRFKVDGGEETPRDSAYRFYPTVTFWTIVWGDRERERERQRDRETERQRDRETERQRDRETERERERDREREREQNMIKPYQPEDVLDIDIAVK